MITARAGGRVRQPALRRLRPSPIQSTHSFERQGDYSALRHVPGGPTVAMGVMSSKEAPVETADELVRQIEEAGR